MLTLRLFHGRRRPEEDLTDWGDDGPILGPLESVHLTYGGITLALPDDELVELTMIDGLIHYDGMFYGDMAMTQSAKPTAAPDQRLAYPEGSFLERREERSAIELPRWALTEYRTRLAVFTDSIREFAGDKAADALHRALANVISRTRIRSRRR